jgi:hypothetical protein
MDRATMAAGDRHELKICGAPGAIALRGMGSRRRDIPSKAGVADLDFPRMCRRLTSMLFGFAVPSGST